MQVEDDAVAPVGLKVGQRLGSGTDDDEFDIIVIQQRSKRRLIGLGVFDYEQTPASTLRERRNARDFGFQNFRRGGLDQKRKGPASKAILPVIIERAHEDGDVPRLRVLLQPVKHRPAQHVRQEDIEDYPRQRIVRCKGESLRPRGCDKSFHALASSKISKDPA